jgi:hypothetical protein
MRQTTTCIATIVIGETYQQSFDRFSRERLVQYCARHGYDLKILTTIIREVPGKKLTWQKILLPELPWWKDYEQVCVLDSDILIARDAPALPVIPHGKIGCVLDKLPNQINSGVLVYRPDEPIAACMKEALKDNEPYWDQRALSQTMAPQNMALLIDKRFNRLFFFMCWTFLASLFQHHWFYHACASKTKLRFIHAWLKLTGR